MKRVRVLFVCMGNICRSPLAEGIFRDLTEKTGQLKTFEIDSAGMGAWHTGDAPDRRSIAVANTHGIDISGQRARRIREEDFTDFDLILAMDHDNLNDLRRIAPAAAIDRIHLFSRFAAGQDSDIPDPYYEGPEAFQVVYTKLLAGCSLLLDALSGTRAS